MHAMHIAHSYNPQHYEFHNSTNGTTDHYHDMIIPGIIGFVMLMVVIIAIFMCNRKE
jgi:hypothetical protein